MTLKNYTMQQIFEMLILPSLWATLKMLAISGILSVIFGFIVGVILILTDKDGLSPNRVIYRILDIVVNIIRSFPFIILMISIIPLTRIIVGSSIGETAALVPLTVAATPFMGRIFQSSFKEVDPALIEAAQSFGATKAQIVIKVMLVESVPSIVSGISLGIINLLGPPLWQALSEQADWAQPPLHTAIRTLMKKIMYSIVVILIILVAVIQFLGDWLYKKLK